MTNQYMGLAVAVLAAATLPASAQSLQQKGYEAVEQRVGDVDPLHQSMRKVESGLYEFGQGSSVFRGPDAQRLYFITQGFTLSYDRSQYFEFEDKHGQTFVAQQVPPNTVFHLGLPQQPQTIAPRAPSSPYEVDAQVDGRVTGQMRANTAAPTDPTIGYDVPSLSHAPMNQWQQYAASRQAQCDAVIAAINRIVNQPAPKEP